MVTLVAVSVAVQSLNLLNQYTALTIAGPAGHPGGAERDERVHVRRVAERAGPDRRKPGRPHPDPGTGGAGRGPQGVRGTPPLHVAAPDPQGTGGAAR